MDIKTAELYDEHGDALQVAEPLLRDYGGKRSFHGPISTVKVHEDNLLVRQTLEESGKGRVLVVDGGGSLRCALVGDRLAQLALDNGWAGLVIHGCIRDSAIIAHIPIGVRALNTNPAKSVKRGAGERNEPVRFAGTSFKPGAYLYADADGIVVAERPCH